MSLNSSGMNDGVEPATGDDAVYSRAIAHIDVLEIKGGAVTEPREVLVGALPGEIVENRDIPVPGSEEPSGIAADEPGSTCDQYSLCGHYSSKSPSTGMQTDPTRPLKPTLDASQCSSQTPRVF